MFNDCTRSTVVDMSSAAIALRLKLMSKLGQERGFVIKGVDMSAAAVDERLRSMNALSRLCSQLGALNAKKAPGITGGSPA